MMIKINPNNLILQKGARLLSRGKIGTIEKVRFFRNKPYYTIQWENGRSAEYSEKELEILDYRVAGSPQPQIPFAASACPKCKSYYPQALDRCEDCGWQQRRKRSLSLEKLSIEKSTGETRQTGKLQPYAPIRMGKRGRRDIR
jgi:hypothetical protein